MGLGAGRERLHRCRGRASGRRKGLGWLDPGCWSYGTKLVVFLRMGRLLGCEGNHPVKLGEKIRSRRRSVEGAE